MLSKKKMILIGLAVLACCIFIAVKILFFSEKFSYAGTLETTKVILSSKVASDITSFPVLEGDAVKEGDILLEMSCDTYKVLSTQIDNDFERASILFKNGDISQSDFDTFDRNKKDNDLKLEWCQVKSPINGTIVTKFREKGEVVSAGTTLLSLADPYDIWAYFYIPHDKVHTIAVGQEITGFLPEIKNQTFKGKVLKINEEAEFTPKNVQTREERTRLVYGIKVQFENPDLILKSGMTIETYLDEK